MAFGRPTIYDESIVAKSEAYLDSCEDIEEQVVSGQSEKFTAYTTKVTVKIPTIEGLALALRIHKDTIYEWEKIHEDFSDVTTRLRNIQADKLINNGLSGKYNNMITKVLLSKHGYTEKIENDGPPQQLTVTISGIEPPPGE
jgi:hypothetical protein